MTLFQKCQSVKVANRDRHDRSRHPLRCHRPADRIMDLVSDYLPERERAAVWKRFYLEVEAGILAVLWAELEKIRWMPGRN